MEDRIADDLVSIAGAAVDDLSCECEAWSNRLTVEVSRIVVVRCLQPLVRMQVVNVMFLRSRVYHSHFYGITDVAVVYVGRIIRIQDFRGLPSENQIPVY